MADNFPRFRQPSVQSNPAEPNIGAITSPYREGAEAAGVAQRALNLGADYLAKQVDQDRKLERLAAMARIDEIKPLAMDDWFRENESDLRTGSVTGIRARLSRGAIDIIAEKYSSQFQDAEHRAMAKAEIVSALASSSSRFISEARNQAIEADAKKRKLALAGFIGDMSSFPADEKTGEHDVAGEYMREYAVSKERIERSYEGGAITREEADIEIAQQGLDLSVAALGSVNARAEQIFTATESASMAQKYLEKQLEVADVIDPRYRDNARIQINNWIQMYREREAAGRDRRERVAQVTFDRDARRLERLIRKEASNLAAGDEKASERANALRERLAAIAEKFPDAETYLSSADANMREAAADLEASRLVGSAIDGSLAGSAIILPTSRAGARVNESLASIISDPKIDDSGKTVMVNNVFSSMNGPVDSGKMYYANMTAAAARDTGYANMLANSLAALEEQNPSAWANFIKTKEGRQAFIFAQTYQLNLASGATPENARAAATEALKRPYNADVIEERRKYIEGTGQSLFAEVVNDEIEGAIDAAYQNTGFSGFLGKNFMDGVEKNRPGYRAIRDRIVSRAKDAYASITASDDPEEDMKRAVRIAAADVRNEFSYAGGEFRRSTPFTFAGSKLTQKAMRDDIAAKLKEGTWVEGASEQGINELLDGVGEWFGNENSGWVLYERRENGLVPVLDKDRKPFIYKPSVVSSQRFIKDTQGGGGGVYIVGE